MIDGIPKVPSITLEHSILDKRVKVVQSSYSNRIELLASDAIIDAVHRLAELNYATVNSILAEHGFSWGKKKPED